MNPLIHDLKSTMEKFTKNCEKLKIVIHADRNPTIAYRELLNMPTASDVTLVIDGQRFKKLDEYILKYNVMETNNSVSVNYIDHMTQYTLY